jgi:hypothetical protein
MPKTRQRSLKYWRLINFWIKKKKISYGPPNKILLKGIRMILTLPPLLSVRPPPVRLDRRIMEVR